MAINQEERNAFDSFRKSSVGRLLLTRIESSITSGIPDVIGNNRLGRYFWIEMKASKTEPKRGTTPVLNGAFEKGQLSYLRTRLSWNCYAFVLLRLVKEFYLLDPKLDLEGIGRDELKASALAVGKENIISHLENLK